MIKMLAGLSTIGKAAGLGSARCGAKPDGIREQDSGYHKDTDRSLPHRYGLLGEIAIATICNIPIDENIYKHGDLYDMNEIEVKSSTREGEDIELKVKCTEYGKKHPKIYILVRVNKGVFNRSPDPEEDKKRRTVEVLGFITAEDFSIKKRRKNYGHEDNWIVSKGDLVDATIDKIKTAVL